ncbi:restriction endonuclease subunit S [Pelomonas aquatica]|uniref:Restriction endonuclease subunit S n=1 Tax=Pelomonas aquatica TaxID=431058 RepID=A0A9X4LKX2_9BURK|nr:restriction endonuclease subunit S [Pelomonas aquatica]MCY4753186.1 restriction endonuclease subunit S [Pelomonas aquatica]MDG0862750.1 restriction endonuclease subunit S [Pelomonas aquatica]
MRGELPAGWAWSSLEQTCTAAGGGTPSKAEPAFWDDGTIPWVSPKDMKARVITGSEDRVTVRALQRLTLIPPDSVLLVVRSGILSRTLPVAVTALPVTVNQDMRAFIPHAGIASDFLAWQLIGKERDVLAATSKDGTTVASIEAPALASFPLAIAPAAEQTRIVEKLEGLLSDLDAGVAELKAAQQKLRHYRQSLLKAAVEGSLTAAWRETHPTPEETGADLLARILRERRARWEAQQLAKFEAQGKTPPKGWQESYSEPAPPAAADMLALPPGWSWASAEQLCTFITKGTTPPKGHDSTGVKAIPFLRVTNLTDRGVLDMADKVFVSAATHQSFLARSKVVPGDVLMNIVGPPLGQVALVPDSRPEWNINQAIAIFRAVDGVLPGFICNYLLSPVAQAWLKARAKTTAGQTNLTLEVCRQLPVPLPPLAEQQEIALALSMQLDSLDSLVSSVSAIERQATAQRQNLLRAAFAGQLVPQDPADEPAAALLARIRAAREAASPLRRGRPARKTSEPA